MAVRKKTLPRSKRQKARATAPVAARVLVAEELFRTAFERMSDSGLTEAGQRQALALAQTGRRRPLKFSKQLLNRAYGLGNLLSHWQKESPYVDAENHPKVLKIRGRGATLETLARRFVPDMRISEVVKAITQYSEVRRFKRDRVVLVGTIFVLIPKTPDLTLAAITQGFQRISRTIAFNSRRPQELGHFQRYASSPLTDPQFVAWLESAKPLLQQHLADTEATMTRAAKGTKGKDTGVAVFVFRDE